MAFHGAPRSTISGYAQRVPAIAIVIFVYNYSCKQHKRETTKLENSTQNDPRILAFAHLIFNYEYSPDNIFEDLNSLYEPKSSTIVFEAATVYDYTDTNTLYYIVDIVEKTVVAHAKTELDLSSAAIFLADAVKALFLFEISENADLDLAD